MNIERPTSNIQLKEKKNKQMWHLEEKLLRYTTRIIKNIVLFPKKIKLRSEATPLFDVRRWTFDVGRSIRSTIIY